MSSKKRIDFPPREFSKVEISSLLMLLAEAQEHISNIGTTIAAVSNTTCYDQSINEMLDKMQGDAFRARDVIDKVQSLITVEKMLITGKDLSPSRKKGANLK